MIFKEEWKKADACKQLFVPFLLTCFHFHTCGSSGSYSLQPGSGTSRGLAAVLGAVVVFYSHTCQHMGNSHYLYLRKEMETTHGGREDLR